MALDGVPSLAKWLGVEAEHERVACDVDGVTVSRCPRNRPDRSGGVRSQGRRRSQATQSPPICSCRTSAVDQSAFCRALCNYWPKFHREAAGAELHRATAALPPLLSRLQRAAPARSPGRCLRWNIRAHGSALGEQQRLSPGRASRCLSRRRSLANTSRSKKSMTGSGPCTLPRSPSPATTSVVAGASNCRGLCGSLRQLRWLRA